MKTTYIGIIFLQGHEADEALGILKGEGEKAALRHLMQWDCGDCGDGGDGGDGGMEREKPSAGFCDEIYEKNDYIMSWNNGLGYIGLERILEIEE